MNIENVTKLRDHLKLVRKTNHSDLFSMMSFITSDELGVVTESYGKPAAVDLLISDPVLSEECGTRACLGGFAYALALKEGTVRRLEWFEGIEGPAAQWLDLNEDQIEHWFYGSWSRKSIENITINDAIQFLTKQIRKAKQAQKVVEEVTA